jgi:hypothetical protein
MKMDNSTQKAKGCPASKDQAVQGCCLARNHEGSLSSSSTPGGSTAGRALGAGLSVKNLLCIPGHMTRGWRVGVWGQAAKTSAEGAWLA